MKGKKPTRVQKKIMIGEGLNPLDWLVLKNPSDELVIINRLSNEEKTIKLR